MSKYLLTYKDAQEIAEKYNNFHFYSSDFMRDGYKLVTFNYFICGYNDFDIPLKNRPEVKAFDMRGTTFVFNKDGSLWKRFFMLPKFFNLNQVETTQYDKIKDKKILDISEKADGSLVAFMMLPDGKLFSKTIGSFSSDQSAAAYQLLYENEEHVEWVKNLLNDGYTPLFEYVSRDNRVVLQYTCPQIRFIGIRDNITGEYHTASEMDVYRIPQSIMQIKSYGGDWEYYLDLAKTIDSKEGWVFKLEDGQLVKLKTQWYFKMHGLRTENVFREDYVICNYLNEALDDLMSMLHPVDDADAFLFVDKVVKSTNNFMAHIDSCVDKLMDEYNSSFYTGHWGKFATDKHREPFFGLFRTKIEKPEEYTTRKKEQVLAMTYHLKQAKQIIETWK
jgi:T4 RnlA family RNA ligase